MATEVTLPNGDEIVFLEPDQLSERARRAIKAAVVGLDPSTLDRIAAAAAEDREVTVDMFTPADLLVADDLNDASMVALISSWTRDGAAVAPTKDNLLDLPGPSYDALAKAAAPLIQQLSVDASSPTPDQSSPTPPASA